MAGSDQGDRDLLQAQEAEVKRLREDLERNRTNQAERPRLGRKPQRGDGKDGDIRFSKDSGKTYVHFKVDGRWCKAELIDE